jgi:hypothetical protein
MPSFFCAGASLAAKATGYQSTALLILDKGLGPEAIVRIFRTSASKIWRRDVSLMLLTGSISEHRSSPSTWSAEPSAGICRSLIGDSFGAISDAASRFVARRWRDIEAAAHGATAA